MDRTNLLPEDLWGVTMSTDDTQTTVVRDCGGQFWSTSDIHSYKNMYRYHPRTSHERPNIQRGDAYLRAGLDDES